MEQLAVFAVFTFPPALHLPAPAMGQHGAQAILEEQDQPWNDTVHCQDGIQGETTNSPYCTKVQYVTVFPQLYTDWSRRTCLAL